MINELVEYIIKREDESTGTAKIWLDDRRLLTTDTYLVIAKDERVAKFMLDLNSYLSIEDIEALYTIDEKGQSLLIEGIFDSVVNNCKSNVKQHDISPTLSILTAQTYIFLYDIGDDFIPEKHQYFISTKDKYVANGYKFVGYKRVNSDKKHKIKYRIEFIMTESITKFNIRTPTRDHLMELLRPQSEDGN